MATVDDTTDSEGDGEDSQAKRREPKRVATVDDTTDSEGDGEDSQAKKRELKSVATVDDMTDSEGEGEDSQAKRRESKDDKVKRQKKGGKRRADATDGWSKRYSTRSALSLPPHSKKLCLGLNLCD